VADFEKLLADLSAAFVRVSFEEIDGEIERWLQRIVFAMNGDRSSIAQAESQDGVIYNTHQWGREGVFVPLKGLKVNSGQTYPWLAAKIRSGELVVISRLEDLPPEASIDLANIRHLRIKSNITIPLRVGGVVVGGVAFGTVFSEREWPQKDIQRLQLVAEVFGNALERKRAEAEIHQLSEELRKASQIVSMGELTASLAHELNQPLAAIRSNSQAARIARGELARS
jgi:formate hydrogenlyase transcriptional activator